MKYLMKIVIITLLSLFVFKSKAQEIKAACVLIDSLFNSAEVISSFHLQNSNDTLILIDKGKWFQNKCQTFNWGNHYVRIEADSLTINEILRKDPYFIFKNNCDVFIIDDFHQKGVLQHYSILQPCSNLLTEAVIKWKNCIFRFVSIKKFVL